MPFSVSGMSRHLPFDQSVILTEVVRQREPRPEGPCGQGDAERDCKSNSHAALTTTRSSGEALAPLGVPLGDKAVDGRAGSVSH